MYSLDYGNLLNRNLPLPILWYMSLPGFFGGTRLYDLVNGRLGTLTGMSLPSTATSGQSLSTTRKNAFGEFRFDGSDDMIVVPRADTGFLGALTVSCWARFTVASAYHALLAKSIGNGGANNPIDFRTNNGATLRLVTVRATAGTNHTWSGSIDLSLNTWHHCVARCSSNLVETQTIFFLDGVKDSSATSGDSGTGAVTGSNADILLGERADAAVKLNGGLDDIRVYDFALTDNQIFGLWTEGLTGYPQTFNRISYDNSFGVSTGGFFSRYYYDMGGVNV